MSTPAQRLEAERLRFPGMTNPREVIILREWLKRRERDFDRFDFNVRVGKGQDPGPSFAEEIRRQAIMNTQKRIDAVGFRGTIVTLMEVKDRAGLSALGQLIGYRALWREEHPLDPQTHLLLITNRVAPDLLPVVREAGIELELVQADFSELRGK